MVKVSRDTVSQLIKKNNPVDSFYVMNLPHLNIAYSAWRITFPSIEPYYAVKCNPDVKIIERLADLGAGFDCASPSEIDACISNGVDASRIIYANPVKRRLDIKYAWDRGVRLTTLDSIQELLKVQEVCPKMEVILRIKASDPSAQCVLSNKYGIEFTDCDEIIKKAKNLVGISFHVGSGSRDPSAYTRALSEAIFLVKKHNLRILDIGGGFIYGNIPKKEISEALIHVPLHVKIIAEPGRYFSENVGTLVCPIIGKKYVADEVQYYISDSLYGSFNCILYDHALPKIECLRDGKLKKSRVFGSTCDGLDEIIASVEMPDLDEGEWVYFSKMGAYTLAASTNFNGIPFNTRLKVYL